MLRNRLSKAETSISIATSFLMVLLLTLCALTLYLLEKNTSLQAITAYGILSTQEPREVALIEDEIKSRFEDGSVEVLISPETENAILSVVFSQREKTKQLKTYLGTVNNVDTWIFNTDFHKPISAAHTFIQMAASCVLVAIALLFFMTVVSQIRLKLYSLGKEILVWKQLGADAAQIRRHFLLPELVGPAIGATLALAVCFLFIQPNLDLRFETPDIGPILLAAAPNRHIISEIILPETNTIVARDKTMVEKKREWLPPLNNFWSRKRIKNVESARQGLLLEAKQGEAVKSASDGTVVYDGQMRGLGKMIIVDHGRGLHSVYAHLGEIKTRIDETLQKGQILGYIGDNVFYFELRQNGKPKTIEQFLRKQ